MPSQYDLGPRLVPSTRFGLLLNGRRVGVEMLDTSLLLLAVTTIGAWMIGALLGGREKRGRWLWLGGVVLARSIALLAFSLFIYVFGAALLPQAWLAYLAAEASSLVRGLLQSLVQQLAMRSLIAGGVWFLAAWALIGLGMWQKPRRAAPPQYRS